MTAHGLTHSHAQNLLTIGDLHVFIFLLSEVKTPKKLAQTPKQYAYYPTGLQSAQLECLETQ